MPPTTGTRRHQSRILKLESLHCEAKHRYFAKHPGDSDVYSHLSIIDQNERCSEVTKGKETISETQFSTELRLKMHIGIETDEV